MAMIRDTAAARLAEDAIVLDLGDLRRQAEQMKREAETEAARIVEEAQAEARRLTDGAEKAGSEIGYAKGHAEGLEAGRAEGHAAALEEATGALGKLQEAWVNAARQWDGERGEMVLEARQSLLELAVRMAEKIVRRVPRVDPAVVQHQVAEAIGHVTGPSDVKVVVHPEDVGLVEEALPGVVEALGQVRHVSLVEDESIGRGGCVVQHGTGRIDATLDTQLRRLVETLLPEGEVRGAGDEGGDEGDARSGEGLGEDEGGESRNVERPDEGGEAE